MFNWLKKKKPAPPPQVAEPQVEEQPRATGASSGEVTALVARWDAAIAEIAQRFDAVLAEATNASGGQPLDATGRIWTAVEHKMHQHTEEVSDGWDEISDEMSDVDDFGEELLDAQGDKRDLANCELEISFNRAQHAAMARAAEQQPGATGAILIAKHAAQQHWEQMYRAQTRINNYRNKRDIPMPLLEQYDTASRQYYTTLLQVEAQHDPSQQQYVQSKLEARLEDANKLLMQHWQWRERS